MNRKKRVVLFAVVVLLVSSVLTMSVFAATDDDTTFNILDGIAGFFRSLINNIGDFISKVISAIKNGVNALIDGIAKVIKAIGDALNYLLSGIKKLFIPSKKSFSDFRDEILSAFDKKFGSVFSALDYLSTRFKGLKGKKGLADVFKVVFPSTSFFRGMSINLLSFASPVLAFFRLCLTGFVCLKTFFYSYDTVIDMVKV